MSDLVVPARPPAAPAPGIPTTRPVLSRNSAQNDMSVWGQVVVGTDDFAPTTAKRPDAPGNNRLKIILGAVVLVAAMVGGYFIVAAVGAKPSPSASEKASTAAAKDSAAGAKDSTASAKAANDSNAAATSGSSAAGSNAAASSAIAAGGAATGSAVTGSAASGSAATGSAAAAAIAGSPTIATAEVDAVSGVGSIIKPKKKTVAKATAKKKPVAKKPAKKPAPKKR